MIKELTMLAWLEGSMALIRQYGCCGVWGLPCTCNCARTR